MNKELFGSDEEEEGEGEGGGGGGGGEGEEEDEGAKSDDKDHVYRMLTEAETALVKGIENLPSLLTQPLPFPETDDPNVAVSKKTIESFLKAVTHGSPSKMAYTTQIVDAGASLTGPLMKEAAANKMFGISVGSTDGRKGVHTPKVVCLVTMFKTAYLFPWQSTTSCPKPLQFILNNQEITFFGVGLEKKIHYLSGGNPANQCFLKKVKMNKGRTIDVTNLGEVMAETPVAQYCTFEGLPLDEDNYIFTLFEKVLGLNVTNDVAPAVERINNMVRHVKLKPNKQVLNRHPELKGALKLFWEELNTEYIQKYLLVKGFLPLADINVLITLGIIIPNLLQYHAEGVVFRTLTDVQKAVLRCIEKGIVKQGPPMDYDSICKSQNVFIMESEAGPCEIQYQSEPSEVTEHTQQVFQITLDDPLLHNDVDIPSATMKELVNLTCQCYNNRTSLYVCSSDLYDYLGAYSTDEMGWCTYYKRHLDAEMAQIVQCPITITNLVGLFNLDGVPSAFNVELYASNSTTVLGYLYSPYLSGNAKQVFEQRVKHIAISHAQATMQPEKPTETVGTLNAVENGAARACDMGPIALYYWFESIRSPNTGVSTMADSKVTTLAVRQWAQQNLANNDIALGYGIRMQQVPASPLRLPDMPKIQDNMDTALIQVAANAPPITAQQMQAAVTLASTSHLHTMLPPPKGESQPAAQPETETEDELPFTQRQTQEMSPLRSSEGSPPLSPDSESFTQQQTQEMPKAKGKPKPPPGGKPLSMARQIQALDVPQIGAIQVNLPPIAPPPLQVPRIYPVVERRSPTLKTPTMSENESEESQ